MRRGLALLVGAAAVASACDRDSDTSGSATSATAPSGPALFTDVTREFGIDFRHHASARGHYRFPEMGGAGGAAFDADENGRIDLYFVDGGRLDATDAADAVTPDRLFLQQANGRFVDATARSGLGDEGYGCGCAVGDVNNDGHLDLFVVNVGPDHLYCGKGDGTFIDVTAEAGLADDAWGSSAAFLDADGDGWLDLYVAQYCDWKRGRPCNDFGGRADFCNPNVYPPLPDTLWHNKGDGTFEDASDAAGIRRIQRRGLGVVAADFDRDGWTDLYVANDGEENHLWMNQEGKGFVDRALLNGAALNAAGRPEASMGIAVGDVDGNGFLDLLSTNLRRETNTLYLNVGKAQFEDRTSSSGLGPPSIPYTGWGTCFTDVDHDGDLDSLVVNGRVVRGEPLLKEPHDAFWDDYAEPNLFFEGLGGGRFADASARAGPFTHEIAVGRGLIPADLDRDGDVDFVVTAIEGPARVYRNDAPKSGHWLQVVPLETRLKRVSIGAEVVVVAGGREFLSAVVPAASYATSGELLAHFGLGELDHFTEIRIHWPGGPIETFPAGAADRRVVVERDHGRAESSPR